MFRKYRGVILMLISVLFLSLAFDGRSLIGRDGFEDQRKDVSVVYNANKSLHDTILADTKALRRSLNDYKKSIVPRKRSGPIPQIKAIDAIIASLRNLYTRYNIANISSIDQYKSLFLDITPFYISNADFYVVLNHIKIIYSSSLFFVFYFLEHIFLVFRKHP